MLRLPNRALSAAAAQALKNWQADIDAMPEYADRVRCAKERFALRNRESDPTFREVRELLRGMCHGAIRCIYCEDSCGEQIEHIAPKDFYPESTFAWPNYLYACGRCNRGKSNKWAVFDRQWTIVELKRNRNDLLTPPQAGHFVFINPRHEDPLDFLELDLAGTFEYVSKLEASSRDQQRAEWTIKHLGLNKRHLVLGRSAAFEACRTSLERYSTLKAEGGSKKRRNNIRQSILLWPHPTVFREMQRQSRYDRRLETLFAPIPEALAWTRSRKALQLAAADRS